MDIRRTFGPAVHRCLTRIRKKFEDCSDEGWSDTETAFCEFTTHEGLAGYQLPLMREIDITDNATLLDHLKEAFAAGFTKKAAETFGEGIEFGGKVAHVLSDPAFTHWITGIESAIAYAAMSFDEEDTRHDVWREYFSNAIRGLHPDKDIWYVTPAEDIDDIRDNVNQIRDRLGMSHYRIYTPPLWLIEYEPPSRLFKPSCLNAGGYPGFWPSMGAWGETVDLDTFGKGVREAIHDQSSPVGINQLHSYPSPERQDTDWKEYCMTRVHLL